MLHSSIPVDLFPADYSAAVKRWSNAVAVLSVKATAFPVTGLSATAPGGEALFTQTAWLGDADAPQVLALIAGTHGVEGFTGTAVQLDFLARLAGGELSLPGKTAVLLIHILTPWGYAWCRRCDEYGIDLNRNFIDFASPPENPGFLELQPYIRNPDPEQRVQAFAAYKTRYGVEQFECAVSGGQYVDPAAPFYGGTRINHGHQVIDTLIGQHRLAQRQLAVVDIHTGLGPYSYGEVICDHPPGSAGLAAAQNWYGAAVTVPAQGTSSSVPKQGLLDYAWHDIMSGSSCFVTLEFGTYSTSALFEALLRDHLFWGETSPENLAEQVGDAKWRQRWQAASKRMQEHFCPADPVWREAVLFRSRQVVHQAIAGLSK